MGSTGYLHPSDCLLHDTGPGHPERPARLEAVSRALQESGLLDELDDRPARAATREEVEAVHDPGYVDLVQRVCERAPAYLDAGDTPVSRDSHRAALAAAGAAAQAAEEIASGRWQRAFVAVRPPGHHAERAAAMGFCIYNHAAIAASLLRTRHGFERVAVLDWDVHHGNGTQHLFEADPTVFYASLHQHPFYPGTGAASEHGVGAGEGATLNVPLPAGSGDVAWVTALEEQVAPVLEAFRPEVLVVSAGFDGHERDPLASARLTAEGYARMSEVALDVAAQCANGRLLSVLEGGYELEALSECVVAHVSTLTAVQGLPGRCA